MVPFVCTSCSVALRVEDTLSGKKARCVACNLEFAVPASIGEALTPSPEMPPTLLPQPPAQINVGAQDAVCIRATPSTQEQRLRPIQSGTVIVGRAPAGYEIERELGRGGMGVVYLARSLTLGRLCALKMILSGAHSDSAEVARFKTEAQAIARLSHPGIVQIFEIGEHDGRPFMALEYCAGGALDAKLAKTPLKPKEAATLLRLLAEAVQAAHDVKVVHRDLKPANVLLSSSLAGSPLRSPEANPQAGKEDAKPQAVGIPKITDFALAKKLDEQGATRTDHVMGTPSYMPPEQALGKKDIGPAADVYALGAILYECLASRPPFREATAYETLMQVLTEEPVAVRRLNPQAPLDLETIAHKCLQKDPKKRYAKAQHLADDLGRYLNGEPIVARPVGAVECAVKWVKRNGVVSAMAACVLLALTAGAVVSSYFAVSAKAEAKAARLAEKKADEEAESARKAKAVAEDREKAEAIAKSDALEAKRRADDSAKEAQEQKQRAEAETKRAEKQLSRAELLVYAGKLSLTQSAFAEGNGVLALQHLEECQWDLRGWEHRHLWTRFNSKQTLKGHILPVRSAAWSSDGKRILTGSADSTAKVWDAAKGTEVLSLKGHTDSVMSVAFSLNGKRILTGSWDGTAKVWDAEKGQELLSLKGHTNSVISVAWSPDGKRIFAWDVQGKVLAWSAVDGQSVEPRDPPQKPNGSPARSPDGHFVAKPDGTSVTITDLREPVTDGFPWPFPNDAERLRYHSEQAALAKNAGHSFAAAFHLGQVLRVMPIVASLHVRLAHLHAELGQSDKAALHFTQALLLNPRVSLVDPHAARRGHAAADAGDWPRAVRNFRSADDRGALLMAQLAAKDPAIRETIAEILAADRDPKRAASLVYWLSAVPLKPAEADRLVAITRRSLATTRNAASLHFHGAALCRAGRHDEALRLLSGSAQAQGQGGYADTWLFLALVQQRRGKHDDAARQLARFEALHKTQTLAWPQRVLYQTLLDEAHRAIGPDAAMDAPRKDK